MSSQNFVTRPGSQFVQSGTGAVERTIESKLQDGVSVKDFGAVGDGISDDTVFIQAALSAAAGKTVYFPKPTVSYKISSVISIPINTSIEAEPGTLIDTSGGITGFSSTNNGTFYTSGGGEGSALGGGLASTATKGTLTLNFNSSLTGVVANDIILISNSADYSWSPFRPNYRQGEFAVVRSVSGSTLILTSPLLDTYQAVGTVSVKKITSTTCSIRGLTIKGQAGGTTNYPTITVNYGRGCVIENCTVIEPTSQGFSLRNSLSSSISNCYAHKAASDGVGVESNGALLTSCQNCTIENSYLSANFHACSVTGGLSIVSRFCTVYNCTLSSNTLWACDIGHDHNEYSKITGNTISGGLQTSGRFASLIDNVFREKVGVSVTGFLAFTESGSFDLNVQNNRFIIDQYLVLTAGDSNYFALDSDCSGGTLQFIGNTIEDATGGKTYLDIRNRGCTAELNIVIKDNNQELVGSSPSTLLRAIVLSGVKYNNLTVNNNTILNGSLSQTTSGYKNLMLHSNTVFNSSNTGASFYFTGGELGVAYISNNTVKGYGSSNSIGGTSGSNLSAVYLSNNSVVDGSSTAIAISYTDLFKSTGNVFGTRTGSYYPLVTQTAVRNVNIFGDTYQSLDKFPLLTTNGYGVEHAQFTLTNTVDLTTPSNKFVLYTIPTGFKYSVLSCVGRTDTTISATSGNYFSLGVDAAARRVDYGVSESAATGGNIYAANTPLSFLSAPTASVDIMYATEELCLMSVDSNADSAALASNIGGTGESISLSINFLVIGRMTAV